jgi:hypothetical protein
MRKALMLSLVMMILAVLLQAQDANKTTTIQGCLKYAKRHYVLTDSSGTEHLLTGYTNKLKPHVGHEIEVTGAEGVHTTSTTVDGASSTVHQAPDFKVSSVKHVDDTCKAGESRGAIKGVITPSIPAIQR